MTVACIVQARLASTRLPNKVLAEILGRPMLAHVVERAQAIPGVDVVALTIPARGKEEEALVWWGRQLGVEVFANQAPLTETTNDVLGAYLKTARALKAEVVVRVTADCPLLDPDLAGIVLDRVGSGLSLFASNCQPVRTYPDGLDVEAFTVGLLEAADLSDSPYDREHVTPGMTALAWHPDAPWEAGAGSVQHIDDLSDVRWTVDTRDDLAKVRRIMAHLPATAAGGWSYAFRDTIRAAQEAGEWP